MRAAGAVKALRARTLGENPSAKGVGGAIGRAAVRLANTFTSKINEWDAKLDGKGKLRRRNVGNDRVA